jgi:hypothetical protein
MHLQLEVAGHILEPGSTINAVGRAADMPGPNGFHGRARRNRWAYNPPMMSLFQVDDDGHLFISPVIEDWGIVAHHNITVVIDLEGGLDECIPTMPGSCLYVYFPIYDEELPDAARLDAVTMMGAHLIRNGHRVLSHCGMGFNRSALVAGRILHHLGMTGPAVVERLRERRPGALFNDVFAEHLSSLPSVST